jgi:hypothetical protein
MPRPASVLFALDESLKTHSLVKIGHHLARGDFHFN